MKVFVVKLSLLGLLTLVACNSSSSDSKDPAGKQAPSLEKPVGASFPEQLTSRSTDKKFKVGDRYEDFHHTVSPDYPCLTSEYLQQYLVQDEPVKNSVLYQLKVSELVYNGHHLTYSITTTVIAINSRSYLTTKPVASDMHNHCEDYVAETFTGDQVDYSETFDLESISVDQFHSEFPRELTLEVRDLDPTQINEIFSRRETMINQLKAKFPKATHTNSHPELSHAMEVVGVSLPDYISKMVKRTQSEDVTKASKIPYIKVGWVVPQN